MRIAAALAAAALFLTGAAGARAAAPDNDGFTAAQAISGAAGTTSGTTLESTLEPGETIWSFWGSSMGDVWFRWTAPSTGWVAFRTSNPSSADVDTLLGAYTGTAVNALTRVAENDDYPNFGVSLMSRIVFNATAGVTYSVPVASYPRNDPSTTQGGFDLDWGDSTYYDVAGPQVSISSIKTGKRTFTVAFTARDDTPVPNWFTTACRLDGGAPVACTSPWTVTNVAGGTHTFSITGTDGAGNAGNTATGTVRVKGP